MPDATGKNITEEMATAAAKEAMKDPRVQQAVEDEARRQGEQALENAKATWCESFGAYTGKLRETPLLFPIGETFTCSQPDDAAWLKFFGKWNILYCQSHLLVFPIWVVLHVLACLWFLVSGAGAGFLWELVRGLASRFVGFAITVLTSHGTYYLFYEKGGCCGGTGAAIWMVIYFIIGFTPVVAFITALVNADDGQVFLTWIQCLYLITVPGVFFMCLCLWKVGGGEAMRAGLARGVAAGKGALDSVRRPTDARDVEAAPGAAPAQASAPLAH